jgi:hypothetical protein
MKYKIFIDSNRLYNQNPIEEPFNLSIRELINFIEKHEIKDINVCIPEIVIRERIQQKLDDIRKTLIDINSLIKSLNGLGHKIDEVIPLSNYKETLEEKVKDYSTRNKITRVPPPSISKEELIDRAINKMKPFDDNFSGFKDTLIYLSIIEDALNSKTCADRYIFCTQDYKQFDEDVIKEFNATTGKVLYISMDTTKIIEKLDELIPLGLHLEDRNKKLKNLIYNNIGDIMNAVNKQETDKTLFGLASSFSHLNRYNPITVNQRYGAYSTYLDNTEQDDFIVGYNYKGIEFLKFDDGASGKYHVEARLSTITKYKDEESSNPYANIDVINTVESTFRFDSLISKTQYFNLYIECDLDNEIISFSSKKSLFL